MLGRLAADAASSACARPRPTSRSRAARPLPAGRAAAARLAAAAEAVHHALREFLHVVVRDAAAGTGAGDLADVDADLARQPAHRRRGGRGGVTATPPAGARRRACGGRRTARARCRRGRLRPLGGVRRAPVPCGGCRLRLPAVSALAAAACAAACCAQHLPRPPPFSIDVSTTWPAFTLSPALTLTSLTMPATDGRHLDGRLVGLELEHRLVDLRSCRRP